MNLLLDTHVLLWWWNDDPALRPDARAALLDRESQVFVSVVTAWEIAIKTALGGLRVDANVEEYIERAGFQKLGVAFRHAERAGRLPHHHGDPFGRMLVAQAQVEGLTFVTHDKRIRPYDLPVLWT